MSELPEARKNKIKFLLEQKFPGQIAPPMGRKQRVRQRAHTLDRIEIERYAAWLEKLPDAELNSLYDSAVQKILEQAERAEAARPFNQPYARARVEHWAKMSYWTPDEAVALSLGREPRFATWKVIESLVTVSRFAFEYSNRREIVVRAKAMGQLSDKPIPRTFVDWAESMQIPLPDELVEAVRTLGVQVMDRKSVFEQQRELLEQTTKDLEECQEARLKERGDYLQNLQNIQEESEHLKEEVQQLGSSLARSKSNNLQTRERSSLLKLVIGMAIKGYAFDPKASRNAAVKEIADDLIRVGLPLDEDTVRKYLTEGKELLPRDETE